MNHHLVLKRKTERLKRMLSPKSAVFIGGAAVAPAIDYCRALGFAGSIYVVNPRRKELAGIPCVPSVGSLPKVPDMAYIAVPRENVTALVRELSALGVAGAVCNTSGFSEMQGGASQFELVKAAGEMPVIGPNCPGVANFVDRSAFMMDQFGRHGTDGHVAVISNGGAYLSDLGCADRALPLAYSVGLGNQAMVSVADVMDVVLDDDRVRAVNIYVEEVVDASALSTAGLKAARKGIPVVALKGGRTNAGRRATQSHTASLAGDEIVTSALFHRLGFVEVRTPTEAIETLKMMLYTGRVKGPRTAVATSSGSYAVMGSDLAEVNGLDLPRPSRAVSEELEKFLPPFVHPTNPLDISSAHSAEFGLQFDIYKSYLLDDWDVAVQVMCFPPEGGSADPESWNTTTKAFAHAAREMNVPAAFVNTLPEPIPAVARKEMVAAGVAPLMGIEDGFRAISNAARFSRMADRLADQPDDEILLPEALGAEDLGTPLDEAAAKTELKAAGIVVPKHSVVKDGQAGGLEALSFPVVVKALSANLAHKSELGAVALNLRNSEDAFEAISSMAETLRDAAPDLLINSYLVEEMAIGGVGELLIGVRRVEGIGLSLTVGMGGTEAELLKDTATILLPASRTVIAEALRGLRLFPLIGGWRGKRKGDVEAAIDAIERFARFAHENRGRLIEAEVNPLIVLAEGNGVVAVDAVMRVAASDSSRSG